MIVGPMFSGKTTELLRVLRKYAIAGYSVVLVKPSTDARYAVNKVVSHDGLEMDALVVEPRFTGLAKVSKLLYEHNVVGIDEFQFFEYTPDLIKFILDLSNERLVIIAALNLDFRGEPWEVVKEILPYAEDVKVLRAVCTYIDEQRRKCGRPASRTQRLLDGRPAPYGSPRVMVGGRESYEARCRKHHIVPRDWE
ncbi:MAG: thymidine kinase [Sulfolobales archaeon]|nr:thymidine kinase [Sulfolobales archaeon]MDW8082709.1 thymidine kinase [Sulfolobales archaeon]